MTVDYDEKILESVSVRRHRLLKALLHGPERTRRRYDEALKTTLISMLLAVLICAGCVGYSFVTGLFADREAARSAPASVELTETADTPEAAAVARPAGHAPEVTGPGGPGTQDQDRHDRRPRPEEAR